MKVLEKSQEQEYNNFMETIAILVMKQSFKHVKQFSDQNVDPRLNSEEIGQAMGQVVLDHIIESTKHMSREELLKWFSEIAISSVVAQMTAHPDYKGKILILSGIL
jgi:hypothetical protein